MKAAFSTWDNRIAPVFDVARRICLVKATPGGIIDQSGEVLTGDVPVQRALGLMAMGAQTLVCGAISRPVLDIFSGYGIRVYPFVAGDLEEVIQAWLRGNLDGDAFVMPGCRGRGRGRGRPTIFQEGYAMNGNPRGARRSRGGAGQGRGEGARGQRTGGVAAGPGGQCVCPRCGYRRIHQRGTPCFEQKCPECDAAMIRA